MSTDVAYIWNQALELLQQALPRPSFETWLRHAKPVALYDTKLVLAVPNEFARDMAERKYNSLLTNTLQSLMGRDVSITFVTLPTPQSHEPATYEPLRTESAGTPTLPPNHSSYQQTTQLNPHYTFENFVIGNSNRFAHAAALAVAQAPARAYNPLFIYGGVGLGKTHLMHAIGNRVLQTHSHLKVVYVSSETFTNELIDAIRDHTTVNFRNRYRTAEVLLIDDIQFLAGKESTQEEFFHTFNALHAANKQIVISSDRPPREIPTLEERLRSRFEGGLISDIQPPDLETRMAILRKKASAEGVQLPDDVAYYIASRITTNIRELQGALIRLIATASISNSPINLETTIEALKDVLPQPKAKQITINTIQQAVARYYNIRLEDLTARRRTHAIAFPRQVAMYLARELTNASLPKIGEEFGGRDHTTVIHACERVMQEAMHDPSFQLVLDQLRQMIQEA